MIWDDNDPNKTSNIGNINPKIYLLIFYEQGKGANGIAGKVKLDSNIAVHSLESLEEFNSFLADVGHDNLIAKKIIDNHDPFSKDTGKLIFESKLGTIDPNMIADGFKILYNLKRNLTKWIKNVEKSITFFVIEEPESNLHPSLQKEIPKILDQIYRTLNPEVAKKIFFLISTHSPFLISSAANYEHQNVFPLKDGKPLVIDFKTQTWQTTNIAESYHGSKCAYVVSKMLGAEITDMGYPENYCILEEYSLQLILDDARNKRIIKNIQFVSASGATKLLGMSETINELEKLDTLVKCNPYYYDKYYLIIDNTTDLDDKAKERLQKIKNKLKNRFVELSLHSLEDYYYNVDSELASEAKSEIEKVNGVEKGRLKAEYAMKIIEHITDKESFSRLFNNELDFLL
ncbi:AAA family ATPase [Flavobacterium panici]|uniref:AAA family ATPase n=1 Tax=Flavobacterium panici TaxID=2654843 RepID=UPI001C610E87|nr:AAA family ATPase [Flavobacterium panici]